MCFCLLSPVTSHPEPGPPKENECTLIPSFLRASEFALGCYPVPAVTFLLKPWEAGAACCVHTTPVCAGMCRSVAHDRNAFILESWLLLGHSTSFLVPSAAGWPDGAESLRTGQVPALSARSCRQVLLCVPRELLPTWLLVPQMRDDQAPCDR